MLVLSRRPLESVYLGWSVGLDPLVRVTVLEVIGAKVKLGFEVGQEELVVHRREVWERILAAARQAGQTGASDAGGPTPGSTHGRA